MDSKTKILYFKNLINENKSDTFIINMNYIASADNKNTFDIDIDGAYFFQKIYLHACLKKRKVIAEYMEKDIYPKLGEIEKIHIRQCFAYGKYLLNK
jgi:hypothetical protein